jgi:methyl-accepting chemotaxis protein
MRNLKFSHKIMLAASLVVIAAFASFAFYNDYMQRNAIRANLENYLRDSFAVVADEVRNLAQRTQSSAQEIQQMIEQLQVGAREAVSTMVESRRFSDDSVRIGKQAGENLKSVTQRIGEIDGMNQSVATATEEQTSVVENLNMDITEINVLNQDGVRNLEASLRACTELDQQAGRLKQLVDSFRI